MNLFTINNAKITAVAHGTDIARHEPPIFCYSRFGRQFVAPVAFHDCGAADPELTPLAMSNLGAGVLVHDFGRAVGYEFADGGCVVGRNYGAEGRKLGELD